MKYYLAGPMTGLPNHNFDLFEKVADALRAKGLDVLAPHDKNKHLAEGEREQMGRNHWIRLDLRDLLKCDALILLPGWENSAGARRELDIALDLSYEVWVLNHDHSMIPITNKGARA